MGSCFPRPFPSRWQHSDTVLTPSLSGPAKPHQLHLFMAPLTAIFHSPPAPTGHPLPCQEEPALCCPRVHPGVGSPALGSAQRTGAGGGSWQERSSCRRTKACHRRRMIYTLNYAYCTRSPNVWKCHTALTIVPNFCPPINVQFPSKDKAVHYFWLTNSAQCTLIFPHALGGQMLHRDCLRAMTEQAHF